MSQRRHRSARERERLFLLHSKLCHCCDMPIQRGEPWDLEHVIPWELTRDDSDENVRPAHKRCHKEKSVDDIRGIRKADRQRQKHEGTAPKSQRGFRGWRKMNGEIVWRA